MVSRDIAPDREAEGVRVTRREAQLPERDPVFGQSRQQNGCV